MLKRAVKMLERRIRSILQPLLETHVYTYRCGLVKGLKRKGGLGFIRMPLRLTPEERFLMRLELKGKTIYDIGGHIGFLTLFFARSVGNTGKVITFEPNPESCAKLQENVRLNNFVNVEIKGIGLGKKREKRALAVRREEPATGSMKENIQSKILKEKWTKTFQVEIDSLDSQIELNSLPKPDFVKIDVEGMEFDVLCGMSETINKCKPSLFIEIHDADAERKIEHVQRVVDLLISYRYSIYHLESGQEITTKSAQLAKKEGHLYCT